MISIIISTKDREVPIIKRLLNSIKESSLKDSEIILVDQNKKDTGIKKLVSEYKKLNSSNKFLYKRHNKEGLSKGRNLGLEFATKNWIWFLDDDAIVSKESINALKNYIQKNKERKTIFFGRVLTQKKEPFIKRRIPVKKLHLWNFDSVSSIAIIFNRKAIQKIGKFDEKLGRGAEFPAGEESDIIIRALKKNIPIFFLNKFIVFHNRSKINKEKAKMNGRGVGAVYRKHIFSSPYSFLVLGTKFFLEIIIRISLFLFTRKSYHIYYLSGFIKGFLEYNIEHHK